MRVSDSASSDRCNGLGDFISNPSVQVVGRTRLGMQARIVPHTPAVPSIAVPLCEGGYTVRAPHMLLVAQAPRSSVW
jgi:hypothetical protein